MQFKVVKTKVSLQKTAQIVKFFSEMDCEDCLIFA